MLETGTGNDPVAESAASVTEPTESAPPGAPVRRRKRRAARILVRSLAALLAVVVLAGLGAYAVLNHLESNIHRIHVTLAAAAEPGKRMTVLITSYETGPTGEAPGGPSTATGVIMLLHLDADGTSGGVVSILPETVVSIPGHGRTTISKATVFGGPSLLVRTVHQVTGVPIDHFARINFSELPNLVSAVGSVDVTVPAAFTSFGHRFTKGVNHLTGVTAVYYARDPAISERDRVLRQQNLLRAAINKVVHQRLLANPLKTIDILNALTSVLTVDSNFSNAQLIALASSLKNVTSNNGTFVTAPTKVVNGSTVLDTAITSQLWSAIDNDSIAAFARQHPSTVTPSTVP
jgi:LCP family protein required for cell wall assembly